MGEDNSVELASVEQLIGGEGLKPREETKILRAVMAERPSLMIPITQSLLNQRRDGQKAVAKALLAGKKAEKLLAKLNEPPLHPAEVLRMERSGRIQVACDGRRLVVAAKPDEDFRDLEPGDEVYLDTSSGFLVARGEKVASSGVVGTVTEVSSGRVMLKGIADEEVVAAATDGLCATLRAGDRVLYRRDVPWVIERLPARDHGRFVLESTPSERFADIGGMGALIDEVRELLDLHLRHPNLVDKYRLELLRGVTLVGSPGVGKTLFAKAIANHLAGFGEGEASFIHVKPGSFRGMYYGQAESRIRELFEVARSAPGIVVVFLDELDSYGSRGEGIGQDIDGRVLGALLSEIDGLEATTNVLCVGATNRIDLCDMALVRKKRMGDRVFAIPRPQREATREILELHLEADLTYADRGAAALAAAATSYLHAAEDGAGVLATVTFRSGESYEVRARDVLSGALLASAVSDAKHAAAHREVQAALVADASHVHESAPGIRYEDLLTALDDALAAEANKIAAPHVARQVLEIPRAAEIARVDVAPKRRASPHHHLRVA